MAAPAVIVVLQSVADRDGGNYISETQTKLGNDETSIKKTVG